MNKWVRDPEINTPPEGYWKELESSLYQNIVDAIINLMQTDPEERFWYVSTYFNAQIMSISDKQFPSVFVYVDSRDDDPLAINTFTHTINIKVEYYAKHHLKRFTEELYYFAEAFESLIYENRKLDGSVPCIQKSTPGTITFDWAVEEKFVIDAVFIDLQVLVTKTAQRRT